MSYAYKYHEYLKTKKVFKGKVGHIIKVVVFIVGIN